MNMKKALLSKIIFCGAVVLMPLSTFALTQRVSVDSSGNQWNWYSSPSSVTPDGRYVLFGSSASNLVVNDTNGVWDVFVRDTINGDTMRVSVDSNDNQLNGWSNTIAISDDGRYILFASDANNAVANDTNGQQDIFMRDTVNNTTTRVNVDNKGNEANNYSSNMLMTLDGRYVAFASDADNLVPNDTNRQTDIFVRDMVTSTITRVNIDSNNNETNWYTYPVWLTPDGRYILFSSTAANLVSLDTNWQEDVFLRDTINNTTIRVNVDSSGNETNNYSYPTAITPDGRYVLFSSDADNLVANDTNNQSDVFVRDILSGTTTRINMKDSVEANNYSYPMAISADGRYVLFGSDADTLVPNDMNGQWDIFLKDMQNNTNVRINTSTSWQETNGYSYVLSISSWLRYILFRSYSTNLVANDTNGIGDLFVRDIVNNTTTRVNVDNTGNQANWNTYWGIITPDGRYVLFGSDANNLVANDVWGIYDWFMNEWQNMPWLAPSIVTPWNGSVLSNSWVIVSGVWNTWYEVQVVLSWVTYTTLTDGNGNWSIGNVWLVDGVYGIQANQRVVWWTWWSMTWTSIFTIDTVSPVVPTIVTPMIWAQLNWTSLYVTGTWEAWGSVTVKVWNVTKVATIDGLGNWNVWAYSVTPWYEYAIVAKQSDMWWNQSVWTTPRNVYVLKWNQAFNLGDYMADLFLIKKWVSEDANGWFLSWSSTVTEPNKNIRYTLEYNNLGTSYATWVVIEEKIPENTCFTIGSMSGMSSDSIVEYSNDWWSTYVYVPTWSVWMQDCWVTNVRVRKWDVLGAKENVVKDWFIWIKNNIGNIWEWLSFITITSTSISLSSSSSRLILTWDFNGDWVIDYFTSLSSNEYNTSQLQVVYW
jgi:uncharacterized repeat protein (TIGR01451 family)